MAAGGHSYLIDATMIRGGGGFTHLVNVLPELAQQAPEDRFRVLCGDPRVAERLPAAPNVEIDDRGAMGLRDRLRFVYLEAPRYAAAWGADLYLSLSEMAPLRAPCATVAAFQNANVCDLGRRQKLHWKQRARFRALNAIARLSARRCDRVLFVSHSSAQWMGDALGVPTQRRVAIPHGIDPARWRRPTCGRSEAHERPYILSVSSIYPYKNYVRLIEAYAQMARSHPDLPDLVIVGDNQDDGYYACMQKAREATGDLAESIHFVGEVSYEQVHRYYHDASLFVFPSHLESFGLPLLEAMASNTPLVASDMPVFREVAGDAAFYADPFDPSALARAMAEALFRPGAREALVKRGRERLEEFTWQRAASQLLTLFREAVQERESPVRAKHSPPTPSEAALPLPARRVVSSLHS